MDRSRWQVFTIGPWTVEPRLHQISRDGLTHRLEPKVMAVLEMLSTRQGQVVSRDELLQTIWADVTVTENVVARAVASLRKVLEDDWRRPTYIQTVSKSGYRMVAEVRPVDTDTSPATRAVAQAVDRRRLLRRRALAATGILGAAVVLVMADGRSDRVPTLRAAGTTPLSVPVTTLPGREMYPAISPDGTRVAFVHPVDTDGDLHSSASWDIFVKDIGSEEVVRLTHEHGADGGPTWSPGGERLAWYRRSDEGCGLYVAPATGGTPDLISPCWQRIMGRLAWSPDGEWLASSESTSPDSPRRVILTEIASGDRQFLTNPPSGARGDQYPMFSPDGAQVAFTRAFPDGRGDVYVISVGGGEPRRLSSENRIVMGLDWTSDGNRLVYSASYGGIPALWSLPAIGGRPTPVRRSDHLVYWPSLSRADDRLVFSRYDDDTNIYTVDLEDGGSDGPPLPRLAAGSTRQELQPHVSPDGERLAFVSNRSGFFEIYTSHRDGTGVRQHTDFRGKIVAMPSWSPDGRSLAFHAHGETGADLYTVAGEERRPERLTDGRANELNASFSNDGQWIYFASDRSGDWQIWRMQIDGERVQQITRDGGFRGMEDPSGQRLIFFKHDEPGIWQVPLTGGPDTILLDEMVLSEFGHWTVTQNGIWFVRRGADAGLAFYDFEAESITTRYRPEKPVPYTPNTLAASPDGTTLVFVQVERSESDVVLLERSAWAGGPCCTVARPRFSALHARRHCPRPRSRRWRTS
ncbi:MAG: winged helix-turn-helix domain-containing protein [Thermoanaerobaculia bacterium]|nr:winged helix-turn-helix domain-containing protein [Thermoanaerobaculia bacterium]